MNNIYVARHGLTESNKMQIYMGKSKEGLSPEGIIQANILGEAAKIYGIRAIYSSPIYRAIQTANIVNEWLNVEIIIENQLTEMKLGPWEGLSEKDVARIFPNDYETWNNMPSRLVLNGRETLYEVQRRAKSAIFRIKGRNAQRPVLMITHVAIIRCLLISFQEINIDLYRKIDIQNTSLFKICLDEEKPKMLRIR